MQKIARRNIMVICEDWRIFRKILKRDLALDKNVWSAVYDVIWSAFGRLDTERSMS